MWSNETHPSPRFIVHETITLVSKDDKRGSAGRRFLQQRVHRIHQTLWPAPLLIEARRNELLVRHDIRGGQRLFDVSHQVADRCWIKFYVFLRVALREARVEPGLVGDVAALSIGVPGV